MRRRTSEMPIYMSEMRRCTSEMPIYTSEMARRTSEMAIYTSEMAWRTSSKPIYTSSMARRTSSMAIYTPSKAIYIASKPIYTTSKQNTIKNPTTATLRVLFKFLMVSFIHKINIYPLGKSQSTNKKRANPKNYNFGVKFLERSPFINIFPEFKCTVKSTLFHTSSLMPSPPEVYL